MKGVKVLLRDAERTKKKLLAEEVLNFEYIPFKDSKNMYFPVNKKVEGFELVDVSFEKKENASSLKEAVKGFLTKKELDMLKTSYDFIGSIAILEIDQELRHKEKVIGESLLKTNSQIKTVLRKDDKHEGVFRTQNMRFLAGEDTRETIHRENGVRMVVDVENVYFSPRLATDRKRVSKQVKPKEEVLVLFSGCGPYCLVIEKKSLAERVVGVEINPKGHEYALKNNELNKTNIEYHNLDAKRYLNSSKERFDRILMPGPDRAEDFLALVKNVMKSKCKVHLYTFAKEEEFEDKKEFFKKTFEDYKVKNLKVVKCGQHAPYIYRVCVEGEVFIT